MSVFCTTAYPSSIFHLSPLFHLERSLPSNRMMASDGGSLGFSPGVTTFGSGHTIPLLYSCSANTAVAAPTAITATRYGRNFFMGGVASGEETGGMVTWIV